LAARMAGIAKGGQIITSGETVAKMLPLMRANTRFLDALSVKGKAENVDVYEIIWQESEELTMMAGRTLLYTAAPVSMRLVHMGKEYRLSADVTSIMLGRDPQADLVIADRKASRLHAKIERRRDKFVYVDQSSNGSFVTFANAAEIVLRREEIMLKGNGRISFGHSYSKDSSEVVEFFCD